MISGQCELRSTAAEIASVLDYDYGRMHWHHTVLGWYPSERIAPLITVNEAGGRVVYIAGELDKAVVTQGDPASYDILAESVRWAGGTPLPVSVEAPPTVDVVSYRSGSTDALLVFLLNRDFVRRHVSPVAEVSLRFPDGTFCPTEVSAITGAATRHTRDSGVTTVRCGVSDVYECLVLRG